MMSVAGSLSMTNRSVSTPGQVRSCQTKSALRRWRSTTLATTACSPSVCLPRTTAAITPPRGEQERRPLMYGVAARDSTVTHHERCTVVLMLVAVIYDSANRQDV
jgi:hypothetical protein